MVPASIDVVPKSVLSDTDGVPSPCAIEIRLPRTLISGLVPVPRSVKLYGFSSGSLFPMLIVPFLVPVALGLNVMVKDRFPPTGIEVGTVRLVEKFEACVTPIVTDVRLSVALPVFPYHTRSGP